MNHEILSSLKSLECITNRFLQLLTSIIQLSHFVFYGMSSFCSVAETKLSQRTWRDVKQLLDPVFELFEKCHSDQILMADTSGQTGTRTKDSLHKKTVQERTLLHSALYNLGNLPNRCSKQSARLQQVFANHCSEISAYANLSPYPKSCKYSTKLLMEKLVKFRNDAVSELYHHRLCKSHGTALDIVLSSSVLVPMIASYLFPQSAVQQYFVPSKSNAALKRAKYSRKPKFLSYMDDYLFVNREPAERQQLLNQKTLESMQLLQQFDTLNILPYLSRFYRIYQKFQTRDVEINRFFHNPFVLYEAWYRRIYKLSVCGIHEHWQNVRYKREQLSQEFKESEIENEKKQMEIEKETKMDHFWDRFHQEQENAPIHHDPIVIDFYAKNFGLLTTNSQVGVYEETMGYYDCYALVAGRGYQRNWKYFQGVRREDYMDCFYELSQTTQYHWTATRHAGETTVTPIMNCFLNLSLISSFFNHRT
jgi:hypothetical protein